MIIISFLSYLFSKCAAITFSLSILKNPIPLRIYKSGLRTGKNDGNKNDCVKNNRKKEEEQEEEATIEEVVMQSIFIR